MRRSCAVSGQGSLYAVDQRTSALGRGGSRPICGLRPTLLLKWVSCLFTSLEANFSVFELISGMDHHIGDQLKVALQPVLGVGLVRCYLKLTITRREYCCYTISQGVGVVSF